MKVSRRQFFKGLGATIGMVGLHGFLKGEIANAEERKPIREGKVGIEWLGHGGFRFVSPGGTELLLDPWLGTNPVCPAKYRTPEGFPKVDIVLYTHGHVDHFMLPDLEAIVKRFDPMIIAPFELGLFIKNKLQAANYGLFQVANKGGAGLIEGVKIHMVGADHSSDAQLYSFEAPPNPVGEPVGYVLEFENGFKIYHSGDTGLMADMKFVIGDYYQPDLAILPIGDIFTMGSREAAYACKLIRPKYVIPEHYRTFPALVQSPNAFLKHTKAYAPGTKVIVMEPGKEIEI